MGIKNHFNREADTKKEGYQEAMFFDWKIQLKEVQYFYKYKKYNTVKKILLTRDLKDAKKLSMNTLSLQN